jgi:hypothetical protein
MPDYPNDSSQNTPKVINEIVTFRHAAESGAAFTGEAELVIELLGSQADAGTNLYSVRVDILSVFDAEGRDVFAPAINDRILKHALEKTALDHYFHPPKVQPVIPLRAEW